MKSRLVLLLASAIVMVALPARAHHSFAAEFDVNAPITLKGTLTKMEWVNPHGWIHIDVLGPDGKVTNWAIEAGAPNALLRRGLRNSDFPAGVEVTVEVGTVDALEAVLRSPLLAHPARRAQARGPVDRGPAAQGWPQRRRAATARR